MSGHHSLKNPGIRRPAWEWPVGSLVLIGYGAFVAQYNEDLRGELTLVVGRVSKSLGSFEDGLDWTWVQKLYCLSKRRYVYTNPYDLEVVGSENWNWRSTSHE